MPHTSELNGKNFLIYVYIYVCYSAWVDQRCHMGSYTLYSGNHREYIAESGVYISTGREYIAESGVVYC